MKQNKIKTISSSSKFQQPTKQVNIDLAKVNSINDSIIGKLKKNTELISSTTSINKNKLLSNPRGSSNSGRISIQSKIGRVEVHQINQYHETIDPNETLELLISKEKNIPRDPISSSSAYINTANNGFFNRKTLNNGIPKQMSHTSKSSKELFFINDNKNKKEYLIPGINNVIIKDSNNVNINYYTRDNQPSTMSNNTTQNIRIFSPSVIYTQPNTQCYNNLRQYTSKTINSQQREEPLTRKQIYSPSLTIQNEPKIQKFKLSNAIETFYKNRSSINNEQFKSSFNSQEKDIGGKVDLDINRNKSLELALYTRRLTSQEGLKKIARLQKKIKDFLIKKRNKYLINKIIKIQSYYRGSLTRGVLNNKLNVILIFSQMILKMRSKVNKQTFKLLRQQKFNPLSYKSKLQQIKNERIRKILNYSKNKDISKGSSKLEHLIKSNKIRTLIYVLSKIFNISVKNYPYIPYSLPYSVKNSFIMEQPSRVTFIQNQYFTIEGNEKLNKSKFKYEENYFNNDRFLLPSGKFDKISQFEDKSVSNRTINPFDYHLKFSSHIMLDYCLIKINESFTRIAFSKFFRNLQNIKYSKLNKTLFTKSINTDNISANMSRNILQRRRSSNITIVSQVNNEENGIKNRNISKNILSDKISFITSIKGINNQNNMIIGLKKLNISLQRQAILSSLLIKIEFKDVFNKMDKFNTWKNKSILDKKPNLKNALLKFKEKEKKNKLDMSTFSALGNISAIPIVNDYATPNKKLIRDDSLLIIESNTKENIENKKKFKSNIFHSTELIEFNKQPIETIKSKEQIELNKVKTELKEIERLTLIKIFSNCQVKLLSRVMKLIYFEKTLKLNIIKMHFMKYECRITGRINKTFKSNLIDSFEEDEEYIDDLYLSYVLFIQQCYKTHLTQNYIRKYAFKLKRLNFIKKRLEISDSSKVNKRFSSWKRNVFIHKITESAKTIENLMVKYKEVLRLRKKIACKNKLKEMFFTHFVYFSFKKTMKCFIEQYKINILKNNILLKCLKKK